ncbi:MAG: hypothetical protein M1834_004393 [Cirrosporium novae-zelandiae]|nr:MAG: hypothetical protein M1834_004393 [Cirrosporium novae-zelandiae]
MGDTPDSSVINVSEAGHPPSANVHFQKPKSKRTPWRRGHRLETLDALQPWPGWEALGRGPYHQYIHNLVEAGWDNLKELDDYMSRDVEDRDLVVSVLDILDDGTLKRFDDLHDEIVLNEFLTDTNSNGMKVRLYMAEQQGPLSSSVMEAFGHYLKLDPRFFQWDIKGNRRLLSPAERHRAPYTSITFTVLNPTPTSSTNTETFKVTVYIQPHGTDEQGPWTGLFLIHSHSKRDFSVNTLIPPPPYNPNPNPNLNNHPPIQRTPLSFRELYLATFSTLDTTSPPFLSPFYITSFLFRLNYFCWNQVITAIREEDQRQLGISEGSINHKEEIKKNLTMVQRWGSLGWRRSKTPLETERKADLEEDFQHLVNQADLVWEARQKMAELRNRRSDARISTLTNAFTFFSIYGMNVIEISGDSSNPDIWQFFVVTIGLNILIVLTLAASHWMQLLLRHNRWVGVKEALRFAAGVQKI